MQETTTSHHSPLMILSALMEQVSKESRNQNSNANSSQGSSTNINNNLNNIFPQQTTTNLNNNNNNPIGGPLNNLNPNIFNTSNLTTNFNNFNNQLPPMLLKPSAMIDNTKRFIQKVESFVSPSLQKVGESAFVSPAIPNGEFIARDMVERICQQYQSHILQLTTEINKLKRPKFSNNPPKRPIQTATSSMAPTTNTTLAHFAKNLAAVTSASNTTTTSATVGNGVFSATRTHSSNSLPGSENSDDRSPLSPTTKSDNEENETDQESEDGGSATRKRKLSGTTGGVAYAELQMDNEKSKKPKFERLIVKEDIIEIMEKARDQGVWALSIPEMGRLLRLKYSDWK